MVSTRSQKADRVLVIGGAGFLGRHIVDALVGSYEVSIFDVRESGDSSAKAIIGDVRKLQDVAEACKGMSVVIHTASVAPSADGSTDQKLAYAINVEGTKNVVKACQMHGVPKLVFTSSSSVVFNNSDLNDVDESVPYAAPCIDYYTRTKTLAEQVVLEANGVQGLATVALRPSGIFGEWDRLFVPQVVAKGKEGKMKYIIGRGKNKMEFTYAGNVADAHVLAAEKLSVGSIIAGKAYFITNDEPVLMWGFMGDVLQGLGYARPSIHLPYYLILFVALLFEWVIQPLLKPFLNLKRSEFTSGRIKIVASNRTLNISRAKKELGYKPSVSLKEGLERTVAHFQYLAKDHEYKKVA